MIKVTSCCKMDLTAICGRCGLDASDLEKELEVGSCQDFNKPPGSIKGRGFLIHLSNYELFKKN